jgi:hypothetical protein
MHVYPSTRSDKHLALLLGCLSHAIQRRMQSALNVPTRFYAYTTLG